MMTSDKHLAWVAAGWTLAVGSVLTPTQPWAVLALAGAAWMAASRARGLS